MSLESIYDSPFLLVPKQGPEPKGFIPKAVSEASALVLKDGRERLILGPFEALPIYCFAKANDLGSSGRVVGVVYAVEASGR